ncbi:MAG: hypothetical protein LBG19_02445 [Prevotellaceae bacterium]|jgi:hypothetical protein|nr:hypothetical protein [Prevotellaceae bacterium]
MYSGRDDKDLVAMDVATGSILWKFYAGSGSDTFNSDFAFYEDKAILFHSKRSVNCIAMETHKLLWKVKFTADLGHENGILWNNFYIVQSVSRNTPILNYININTGEIEKQVKLTSEYSDSASAVGMSYSDVFPWGDRVWYKSRNGHICCVDLAKGERIEVNFTGCGCNNSWMIGSDEHAILNDELYMCAVGGGLEHGWYKFGQDMQLKLMALTADANMSGFGYHCDNYMVCAFTDRDTAKSMVNMLELTTGKYQCFEIPNAVSLECAILYDDKLIVTDNIGNDREATIHIFSYR